MCLSRSFSASASASKASLHAFHFGWSSVPMSAITTTGIWFNLFRLQANCLTDEESSHQRGQLNLWWAKCLTGLYAAFRHPGTTRGGDGSVRIIRAVHADGSEEHAAHALLGGGRCTAS
jgi:hypothetical protein